MTLRLLSNINCQHRIFDGRMMIMVITKQRLEFRLVSVVTWNVGKWLGTRQVGIDVSAVASAMLFTVTFESYPSILFSDLVDEVVKGLFL